MIDELSRPMAAALHVKHCDAENNRDPSHVCQGTISITAATCTFECARCGFDRINISQQVETIRNLDRIKLEQDAADLEVFRRELEQREAFNA